MIKMKRTTQKGESQIVEFIAFYNSTKDTYSQTLEDLERWIEEGDNVLASFEMERECYESTIIIKSDLSEKVFYTCSGSVYEILKKEE